MWNLNDVKEIEYKTDYSHRIVFDDGISAAVDFPEYLHRGPVFAPLRDTEFFRMARIEGGAIAWLNGADIAPETSTRNVNRQYPEVLENAREKRNAPFSRRGCL